MPSTSSATARGWSPAGSKSETTLNGGMRRSIVPVFAATSCQGWSGRAGNGRRVGGLGDGGPRLRRPPPARPPVVTLFSSSRRRVCSAECHASSSAMSHLGLGDVGHLRRSRARWWKDVVVRTAAEEEMPTTCRCSRRASPSTGCHAPRAGACRPRARLYGRAADPTEVESSPHVETPRVQRRIEALDLIETQLQSIVDGSSRGVGTGDDRRHRHCAVAGFERDEASRDGDQHRSTTSTDRSVRGGAPSHWRSRSAPSPTLGSSLFAVVALLAGRHRSRSEPPRRPLPTAARQSWPLARAAGPARLVECHIASST